MKGRARNKISNWGTACLALGLSIGLAACGGGGDSNPPLSVSVTSASSTVAAGASAQVTATVLNDSLNEGVTWSVSCSAAPCGSVSPAFTLSGAATTYTAPGAAQSPGFTVAITATAVVNPAISGAVKVAISEPLWVSVNTPGQTPLPPSASVQVTATVGNDAATKGVTWSVSCSVSPCGTVSPTTTQSGVATTYTAPQGLAPEQGVTITATSVSDPNQAAATSVQIGSSIQINLVPSSGTVPGGATAQITATLSNYPLGGELSWTVSCAAANSCGSVSPTSSASGATVTYTAPMPPPPPGPLQVTLTATSATSASVQASTSVTVPAVTVGVVPVTALSPVNTSQKFTATVGYDIANKGVTWALTQNGAPCSPACGTVNPGSTASGSPATYSAPAALPANRSVVLTATSATEASVSAAASVTLTNGSVSLVPADMTFEGCNKRSCPVPSQVAVLTNTGPSALSISGLTIGGTNASDFAESNTCGKTLAAGASCNITVTYTSGSTGTHTAVLSIADNSPDTPQQLSLTGINRASIAAALQSALRDQSVAAVPRPTGNSQVGTRLLHWVDDSRMDPYRADGTKRELMVRFWYPTSVNAACTPADYTSAGVLRQFSHLLHTTLLQISTNSCLNAPVARGAHPVVVVTPGFTGTFTDYTFLTEDLASRGYVVVAVDHTYEATAVEFPDGRIEQGMFGSSLTRYTRSDPQALAFAVSVRLADLRFVVDELTALTGGGDTAFAGKLDLARIALAGHSLGGLTAVRGVEKDARFRAGISLDGFVPDRLTPPTTTPVLLIRAGNDPWNENDCHLWSALRGVHTAVNLSGAEHIALSDAVWLANGAVATGAMGVEKTLAAVRDASAAFLDEIFRGGPLNVPTVRSLMNNPDAVEITQDQSPCGLP